MLKHIQQKENVLFKSMFVILRELRFGKIFQKVIVLNSKRNAKNCQTDEPLEDSTDIFKSNMLDMIDMMIDQMKALKVYVQKD